MLSRSLRRPENWQDFETLCKKLWGEIWNCPEIKKNGRSGQAQNGVDLYGTPSSEHQYYGIQCKGKDEYTNKQFTESEILKEIKLAKNFKPALKKLYLATTAIKDVGIEEFVRECDLENRSLGLFEVHLYCWEDIVDLIDENRQTHDWYVKNQGFKQNKQVKLSFQDGISELTLRPKFKQKRTVYFKTPPSNPLAVSIPDLLRKYPDPSGHLGACTNARIISASFTRKEINQSYVCFEIMVRNIGVNPIEEYKVLLEFVGNVTDIAKSNTTSRLPILLSKRYTPTTYLFAEDFTGKLIPRTNILVGDDIFRSEDIYLKPDPEETQILVKCKLISKDFKFEETLTLKLDPEIIYQNKEITVDEVPENSIEYGEFEEYIETED